MKLDGQLNLRNCYKSWKLATRGDLFSHVRVYININNSGLNGSYLVLRFKKIQRFFFPIFYLSREKNRKLISSYWRLRIISRKLILTS